MGKAKAAAGRPEETAKETGARVRRVHLAVRALLKEFPDARDPNVEDVKDPSDKDAKDPNNKDKDPNDDDDSKKTRTHALGSSIEKLAQRLSERVIAEAMGEEMDDCTFSLALQPHIDQMKEGLDQERAKAQAAVWPPPKDEARVGRAAPQQRATSAGNLSGGQPLATGHARAHQVSMRKQLRQTLDAVSETPPRRATQTYHRLAQAKVASSSPPGSRRQETAGERASRLAKESTGVGAEKQAVADPDWGHFLRSSVPDFRRELPPCFSRSPVASRL